MATDIFTYYLFRTSTKHRCSDCGRVYDEVRTKICPRCGSSKRDIKCLHGYKECENEGNCANTEGCLEIIERMKK